MTRTPMQFVACAAAVLSPILMLSVKGGAGYCFFAVLMASLVHLVGTDARKQAASLYRVHRGFVIGLLALPVVLLFQIVVLRTGTFSAFDPFLRFALVVPCFFLLASLPSQQLRLVQWGFVAGALLVGAWAVYMSFYPNQWTMSGRLGNSFTNPIPFGDTALLLAFLAAISISRSQRIHAAEIVIKTAALLLGGYASLLSGSRGGWIAAPVLLWATFSGRHWLNSTRARLILAALLVACITALALSGTIRTRMGAASTDIESLHRGDGNTSTGLRLNLWRACAKLYVEHPVFGVGRGRLDEALDSLASRGEAPREIVNAGGHSEFFSAISQTGTVGLIALLILYAGTFRAFWRYRHDSDPDVVTAAYMGLGTVGATVIFGLTIDALTLVMNASFLALTLATLLAWIDARMRETGRGGGQKGLVFAQPPRSILIVCTRRIGDVLLATPLVRSLKTKWPDTPIDMLVFRGTEGVLEHNPDIRNVITVAQRTGMRERIADIGRLWRRYELACAVNGSDRSLIYAWLAGRKRIGVANADHVTLLARWSLDKIALDRHLTMHTVSSVLALAPLVGAMPLGEIAAPGIGDDPDRVKRFEARFAAQPAARLDQPLVVLHPSPMYAYKQWHIDGWADTIRWLHEHGYAIALSGGPGVAERDYAERVIATAGVPVLNFVGELSFGESAELFRRAKLYIGPDTGATHVAAACGIPVIALFGPTDPVRWAPWPYHWQAGNEPWSRYGSAMRGNVCLLQGESDCVPCRGEGCDGHQNSDSRCLTQLSSQRVIAAAARLLGLPAPLAPSH